jgi:predicted Zn-dependent protease
VFLARDRKAEKFINEGKFVEAQTLLKDVYKLKENSLPILETLAELYIRHNKLADALECFRSCLEVKVSL